MKILKGIILILVTLLLASCASLESAIQQYEKAPICCTKFSEIDFQKLNIPDSRNFDIDEKSKAMIIDGSKSFLQGFELPTGQNFSVTINSFRMGPSMRNSYIFGPAVYILDKNFKINRKVETDSFEFKRTKFKTDWNLTGEIKFTDNPNEKYLVIFTSLNKKKEGESVNLPKVIGVWFPIVTVIPTGEREDVGIPYSPTGNLSILVKNNN